MQTDASNGPEVGIDDQGTVDTPADAVSFAKDREATLREELRPQLEPPARNRQQHLGLHLSRDLLKKTAPTLIRSAIAAMPLAPSNSGTGERGGKEGPSSARAWFIVTRLIKRAIEPIFIFVPMIFSCRSGTNVHPGYTAFSYPGTQRIVAAGARR
jgi:hypothetical protein